MKSKQRNFKPLYALTLYTPGFKCSPYTTIMYRSISCIDKKTLIKAHRYAVSRGIPCSIGDVKFKKDCTIEGMRPICSVGYYGFARNPRSKEKGKELTEWTYKDIRDVINIEYPRLMKDIRERLDVIFSDIDNDNNNGIFNYISKEE